VREPAATRIDLRPELSPGAVGAAPGTAQLAVQAGRHGGVGAGLEPSGPDLESDVRLLPSGDEAGTAPGDRKFRPDVDGLRAVAIGLVVLYHAGVGSLSGGFVGVDVFFVISGFVITGLLLREHESSGRTSLSGFYARRARRILPAATIAVIVTLFGSYHFLGFLRGDATASDGTAAGLFFANFHFAHAGANYLSSQQPPSPLQNFWSLSVEEQFYVVFPSLVLVIGTLGGRRRFPLKLGVVLGGVIVASFIWSVHATAVDPTSAYFSPFTRAWELAVGALVAVGARWFLRIPRLVGSVISWIGIGAIAFASFALNAATPYPGSAVALPVLGAAAVIGGGTCQPRAGAESLLRIRPFQWLGLISYSLYLWHWPILTIAHQVAGHALSTSVNLLWVLLALGLAVVSYFLVEKPIRHAGVLVRSRVSSLGLGALLIGATVITCAIERAVHP
jgi:peptidoglycan/LPS O-acetylase OafA/YrhL